MWKNYPIPHDDPIVPEYLVAKWVWLCCWMASRRESRSRLEHTCRPPALLPTRDDERGGRSRRTGAEEAGVCLDFVLFKPFCSYIIYYHNFTLHQFEFSNQIFNKQCTFVSRSNVSVILLYKYLVQNFGKRVYIELLLVENSFGCTDKRPCAQVWAKK